ncbi:MAG: bifunctional phosphoribosyl-AMP cyclohydrolase/phosphoribosyl-ATP diphosphatase HisIE [Candidatus Magasanikbacteria bacterium]|jgi:phosphoribosyl-AMP cyclohydrolase / phosphoribosyl-ATP pyrophosphohydrolase|nr:bifunctional phosphoribosyl-AMP cyclohydrolase/phosphoribosyl-ATP diphosphatase HisIE [Candidatus Magasanikbacteria bacterium]MBT4314865.1 bifunctional phosphoribosyl-AMP cyclohydrolase/phosphoribosyl-ATP diphosphatase HisIE [Candidatus Magasanikbacteria bacterium]MBT4546748.1 bifunctional phosphoribosyl-AMP cyclohydrolase/phosphoribosyl-ATP diphosphatase HisIE [Candidatus Magasanikbacteria bacterium]MBT6819643.1 bifunctional phosphoribosyl-AMP cyclohydrolase/phosphoribosyl-ATP diphosphatase 
MKNVTKKINWKKTDDLIPTVIQDEQTNRVLMLGYMNKKALKKTIKTKKVWFFSRTKKRLWMKGEESKNYLLLKNIDLDCDNDTLLIKVKPIGPTCHSGLESCFDNKNMKKNIINVGIIAELYSVIEKRKKELPKNSYTTKMLEQGLSKMEEKIMEEAEEVCQAAKKETKQRLVEESVDVLYHLLVLLVYKDVKIEKILREIKKRRK